MGHTRRRLNTTDDVITVNMVDEVTAGAKGGSLIIGLPSHPLLVEQVTGWIADIESFAGLDKRRALHQDKG